MGEWMERAMMVQRQMDLSKAIRDGTNTAGVFQRSQRPNVARPYSSTTSNNWRGNVGQPKRDQQLNPTPNSGQTFGGQGEPMQIDWRKQQCHFCGRFRRVQKDCRRKLGLCLKCGKAGHQARNCGEQRVRRTEITEEREEPEQGFVEDL